MVPWEQGSTILCLLVLFLKIKIITCTPRECLCAIGSSNYFTCTPSFYICKQFCEKEIEAQRSEMTSHAAHSLTSKGTGSGFGTQVVQLQSFNDCVYHDECLPHASHSTQLLSGTIL